MYEVDCPYCDGTQTEDLEGSQYEDDYQSETECVNCGKYFVFFTSVNISLNAEKADCLNGSPHAFVATHIWPIHPYSVRLCRCSDCSEEKQFSVEELKELNIPYKEEWKEFDEREGIHAPF